MKVTLNEHLAMIDQNAPVSDEEISRIFENARNRFRDCGFTGLWEGCKLRGKKNLSRRKQCESLVHEYIKMIFETQDNRCTHWLFTKDDELNGVWNRPNGGYRGWKITYIKYEIDHVNPINAGGKDDLANYQFLSANANQFTKCSLTYDDLLRRVDLSAELKNRIRTVLKRREELFKSAKWTDYMSRVEKANESR
jgi:hypothetical protein